MKKKDRIYWAIGAGGVSLLLAGIIVHYTNWADWTALPLFFVLLGISLWVIYSS